MARQTNSDNKDKENPSNEPQADAAREAIMKQSATARYKQNQANMASQVFDALLTNPNVERWLGMPGDAAKSASGTTFGQRAARVAHQIANDFADELDKLITEDLADNEKESA